MDPALAVLETVLEWLEPLFGDGYGYVIVAILLERIILVGSFVPGETIMVLGVVLATPPTGVTSHFELDIRTGRVV